MLSTCTAYAEGVEMDRLEWKERMRKIKYANKKAGIGWGKGKIKIAAEMILATQKNTGNPGNGDGSNTIGDILKGIIKSHE